MHRTCSWLVLVSVSLVAVGCSSSSPIGPAAVEPLDDIAADAPDEVSSNGEPSSSALSSSWPPASDTDHAQDSGAATTVADKGCDGGDAESCFNDGVALLGSGSAQQEEIFSLFEKSCQAGHAKGCRQAGVMHLEGAGTPKNAAVALERFERGCELADMVSCKNAGIVLAQGKGIPKDLPRAAKLFAKSCKSGDEQSCALEKEVTTPATPSVAGANLTMGSASADGFEARDLSCKADGLGLFGGIVLIAALAKKKSTLDRCAPAGAKPSVRWTFAGNRVSKVSVTRHYARGSILRQARPARRQHGGQRRVRRHAVDRQLTISCSFARLAGRRSRPPRRAHQGGATQRSGR